MRTLGLLLALSLAGCLDMPPRPGPGSGGPPIDAPASGGDAPLSDAAFGATILDSATALWRGLASYVPSLGYLQADAVSSVGRNPTRS